METGAKLFLTSIGLVSLGALAFVLGIAAAFERAGNWSNDLALVGVLFMVVGGLLNLAATLSGLVLYVEGKAIRWWWACSLIGTVGVIVSGLVALRL